MQGLKWFTGIWELCRPACSLSLVGESHDLYILLLTMLTPDPMLPRLKIAVFHHLVTVGTPGGERIDGYLSALRHVDFR